MTEEELMALLSSLSPEDLSALGLDGLFGPQLNQANFDLSSAMPIPAGTYDSKGRPEPYDLDTAAKAANVRQDYNSMLFDNVTGAMGGPGSYGLDAFTPKLKYGGDIAQQPGRQQADYYANSAGLGYQAAVAQEILSGVTPDVAAAHVMQLAMTPDEELTSEEARAQRDAIRQTLPPAPAGQGRTSSRRSGTRSPPSSSSPCSTTRRRSTTSPGNSAPRSPVTRRAASPMRRPASPTTRLRSRSGRRRRRSSWTSGCRSPPTSTPTATTSRRWRRSTWT